ncbi:FkbM family methyltransferase [Flavobacterium sp.]|jgi:FkbM family methyltransferase|uniref:FkbM family methyltransferase n=1 Tax=Flavobacterium sp. TaxID=239 RepID=UPI0037C0749D
MLKKLAKLRLLKKYFSLKDALSLYFGLKNNSEEIYLSNLGRKIYLRKNTKDTETFEEIFLSSLYDTALPIVPKTIVDAGANVGLASLFFRMKYPNASIVAIEIEDKNILAIRKNTADFTNFEIKHNALFNKKAYFKIIDPYNATNSFQIVETTNPEEANSTSVTLDEILTTKKWETIDVLKIDIEGAEKQLFESNYENWLPKTKIIMVETHDRMIPKCSFTVMNTINQFNFILYTTTEGTLIYYNLDYITLP